MNFTGVNLDLQGVKKRTYANLLYQSTFYKMLDRTYLQAERHGMPIIEVIKQKSTGINVRNNVEIANEGIKTKLANYESVKVDLTELPMDYSFRISPVVMGSGIERAIEGQLEIKDSDVAYQIDEYGFGKLNSEIVGPEDGSMAYTEGQITKWSPSNGTEVIEFLNDVKAKLFDRNIRSNYILALRSDQYAYLVSQITSILKYETRAGVEGVDEGEVASAYGVSIFPVNSNVLKVNGQNSNTIGFFGNEVATVGDTFWSSLVQFNGNYQGFPGYFVCEGNIMFGAKVVRPEGLIKLVTEIPQLTDGSFDAGTINTEYSHTTAFTGTNVVKYEASGLPNGLSLNATNGQITGTPTEAGEYNVAVYGIDAYGNYSNALTGTINIA